MTVNVLRSLLPALCLFGTLSPARLSAQIPTKCLEIESILVDACNPSPCSSDEGPSEMVRFRTGPTAIAIGEISVTWPNNTWRGLAQNATTASITAQLNATITGCGRLLEPPGGVIPPGSPVILVTSTELCVQGNSFAALSDTIYMVYQVAGNTAGHFGNGPGGTVSTTPPSGNDTRTMIMTYTPTNCRDTATYVRELLVNLYGSYGGTTAERNGSTVEFSWPGVPVATYVNYGCQAPFVPLVVEAEAVGTLCGATGTVNISAQVNGGTFTTGQWSGGTGTFGDPGAQNTTYTAGAGDLANVVLTFCAQTTCADPVCGSVTVASGSGPTVSIAADGPLALCPGEDVVLTGEGADSYAWSGGQVTPSITVTTLGTVTVTGTNACGTGTATVEVGPGTIPTVTISGNTDLCPGESTTLTASGASSYLWSTAEFTPSITVSTTDTYSVTGSNNCGSSTQTVTVTNGTAPSVAITGDLEICSGESTTLTATGNGTLLWSNSSTNASITVSTTGTYSVTATNGCGTANASVTVVQSAGPSVTVSGNLGFCPGQTTTLTASGADGYTWSNGTSGASVTVGVAGPITVTGTSGCGSDDATVTLTELAVPTVVVSGDDLICPGGQAVLTATSNAAVTWSNSASGSTITVTSAGTFTATATNACGTDSDDIQVIASPLDAAFVPSVSSGLAPLTVQFNNGTAPAGATYDWDFDGEGTSTNTSPTHLFEVPGVYVITLEATLDGCTSTATATINVGTVVPGSASSVVIPNVFTPNGDRQNDLFVVTAVNIVRMNMLIYNRWGQKVNELGRVGEAWDARSMSGSLVPDGTYFYTFIAEGVDGKQYDLTGHITLLR